MFIFLVKLMIVLIILKKVVLIVLIIFCIFVIVLGGNIFFRVIVFLLLFLNKLKKFCNVSLVVLNVFVILEIVRFIIFLKVFECL